MSKKINVIVAREKENGIGLHSGKIPWYIKKDLAYFKSLTTETKDPTKQNAVIMGRKTWESLPEAFKPLPNRTNIILSQNTHFITPEECPLLHSLPAAIDYCNAQSKIESIFIIGGGTIYEQSLEQLQIDQLFITQLSTPISCDVFFTFNANHFIQTDSSEWFTENDLPFRFERWIPSA